jgi:hypothetical protein
MSRKEVDELISGRAFTDPQKEALESCHVTAMYGKLWIEDMDSCCEPSCGELLDVNGVCPECGTPTVDGQAVTGCSYSPVCCEVCGHQGCDGSC